MSTPIGNQSGPSQIPLTLPEGELNSVQVGDVTVKYDPSLSTQTITCKNVSDSGETMTGITQLTKLENGDLSIRVSLDPNSPALYMSGNPENLGSASDSWFGGFVAILSKIMAGVVSTQKDIKTLEKEIEIFARMASWDATKDLSKQHIAMGDANASLKYMEAARGMMEAASSIVQLNQTRRNENKLKGMANDPSSDLGKLKQARDQAQTRYEASKGNGPQVADHQAGLGNAQGDPKLKAQYEAANAEYSASERSMRNTMNEHTQQAAKIFTSIFGSALNFVQAGIETEKARMEALMEILRGLKKNYENMENIAGQTGSGTKTIMDDYFQLLGKINMSGK
jgi:hypothetical protein